METHDETPGGAPEAPPPSPMESLCRAVQRLLALLASQAPVEERARATEAVGDAMTRLELHYRSRPSP